MAGDSNTVVSHALTANFAAAGVHLKIDDTDEPISEGNPDSEYWTPERVAGATPFALKRLRNPPAEPLIDKDRLRELLRGRGVEARDKSQPPAGVETSRFKAVLAPPYDTELVPNRIAFPYSAIGKLLATIGGQDFAGTAWVVGTRSIVTAGHCLYDDSQQQWATNVAFMPQFDAGSVRGTWTATTIHTLAGWIGGGPNAAAFDLAAATLSRPIDPTTGRIGWRANGPVQQGLLHSVGYPSDWISTTYNFDGRHMWSCNGRYAGGTSVIGMHNNMTRGSSGGPWLVQDAQKNIFACGVNSFYAEDGSAIMYSPYFGQGIANLIAASA